MYLILVYDMNEKRVNKAMKICRQYLNHIQNSVFEGEITSAKYKELTSKLNKILKKNEDSVIIYELWNNNFKRKILGIEKREINNII